MLVGETGFEPTTSASRRQRSTRLSYTPTVGAILRDAANAFNLCPRKDAVSAYLEVRTELSERQLHIQAHSRVEREPLTRRR